MMVRQVRLNFPVFMRNRTIRKRAHHMATSGEQPVHLPMASALHHDAGAKEKSMGQQTKHFMNEADIGSGEKSSGQEDLEKAELAVPPTGNMESLPDGGASPEGRLLQSGTHLARIVAVPQPDGTYEAQVFVRLTREPEVAETYIPVGTYPTEKAAWTAAEQRAQRAFTENEF